jgi:hypothetical protein
LPPLLDPAIDPAYQPEAAELDSREPEPAL